MDWRATLENTLDVILRIPPLFVMDSILAQRLGPADWTSDVESISITYIAWLALQLVCFLVSACVITLQLRQLVDVYCFLISWGLILLSYGYNKVYIEQQVKEDSYAGDLATLVRDADLHLAQLFLQICLGLGYYTIRCDLQSEPYGFLSLGGLGKCRPWMFAFFLLPLTFRLALIPPYVLTFVPAVVSLIVGLEFVVAFLLQINAIVFLMRRAYIQGMYVLKNHGLQLFLETQWDRLHIPLVLQLFWLIRTGVFLCYLGYGKLQGYTEEAEVHGNASEVFVLAAVRDVGRDVLVRGCETVVSLLGMTSVVSYVTHFIGLVMAAAAKSDNDEDRNMGTMCAILFFVLALQTGLTGLDPEKRFVRLFRNFCLLFTAILHFVHSMVHPLLINASATGSVSSTRHVRLLTICAFLLFLPVLLLCYLWTHHVASTWLLAVTAFSIEVMFKVIITLLIYSLFVIDAYRETFWEKLDDYIYYIKSAGNSVEFLFGIFLFCNGAWIMVFESGGFIRALMMCIHAYFNIFMQAKEGWKVFMKRRTAVQKINSLPKATQEELSRHNDVCAICYQDLNSARMTRCHHLFHTACLRKWLYSQDKCPLCHKLIYKPEDSASQSTSNDPPFAVHAVVDNGEHRENGAVQHQHID